MENFFHTPKTWSPPAPFQIHVKVECFTLSFNVYGSIGFIPYEAGKVVHFSRSPCCIAEAYPLYMSENLNIVVFFQNRDIFQVNLLNY